METRAFPVHGTIMGSQKPMPCTKCNNPAHCEQLVTLILQVQNWLNQASRITTLMSKNARERKMQENRLLYKDRPECSTSLPALHAVWARKSRAKGSLPSAGPDSPLLRASFSLQKFLQSYENTCACQDSRKMLLPVRERNYIALPLRKSGLL